MALQNAVAHEDVDEYDEGIPDTHALNPGESGAESGTHLDDDHRSKDARREERENRSNHDSKRVHRLVRVHRSASCASTGGRHVPSVASRCIERGSDLLVAEG